jgi:hypothetical protein
LAAIGNSYKECIHVLIAMNHSSLNISTIIAVVLALGIVGSTTVNAFLMTTTPAYAAPAKDKVITRGQGEAGAAVWNDISVDVPGIGIVVNVLLNAFETEAGTDIRVQLETFEIETGEHNFLEGFTTIDQNVFDAEKKLTSATLSPVTMQVDVFDEHFNLIGTAEITIQATWDGTGDLATSKDNQHIKSDNFSVKFKGSSLFREATAEGSINNANLGTSDAAQLNAFKQVEMTVSKSIIS